jgi:hypothetical protein
MDIGNKFNQELISCTPSSKIILEKTWPLLSVESKINIILEIQNKKYARSCPDWLFDIAILDESEIVRFYCVKSFYLSTEPDYKGNPPTLENIERLNKIRQDNSDLVKSAYKINMLVPSTDISESELLSLSHLEQAFYIRYCLDFNFTNMVNMVDLIFRSNLNDEQAYDLSLEITEHPEFSNAISEKKYLDGFMANDAGKDLERMWKLLHQINRLKSSILFIKLLPFKRGLGSVEPEFLATLNETLIFGLLYRSIDDSSMILSELINVLTAKSMNYSKSLIETVDFVITERGQRGKGRF